MNQSQINKRKNRTSMGGSNSHSNSNSNSKQQLQQQQQQQHSQPQLRQQRQSHERNEKNAHSEVNAEGIYANCRVMHVTTSLVGCVVQIELKDSKKYEGVLKTFSSDFELVLEAVALMENQNKESNGNLGPNIGNLLTSLQAKNTLLPKMIINFSDIVKISALNVDLDFATQSNQQDHFVTDSEISRMSQKGLNPSERELVPWVADDGDLPDDGHLLLDGHESAQNGWDADDMFKMNKEKFQVKTNYDPNLTGYTVALEKGEGEEYEQKKAEAARIAREIEGDTTCKERYDKEINDGDEEDQFSAVVRPAIAEAQPTQNTSHNNNSRHQQRNKRQGNQGNFNLNSGPPGVRSSRPHNASPPFHSANRNQSGVSSSNYNKQQYSNSPSINSPTSTTPNYQSQKVYSNQNQNQTSKDEPSQTKPQYAGVAAQNCAKVEPEDNSSNSQGGNVPNQIPSQRNQDNRRSDRNTGKRKDEPSEVKKFNNESSYKSSSTTDSTVNKDKDNKQTDFYVKDNSTGASNASTTKTKDNSVVSAVKEHKPDNNTTENKENSEKQLELNKQVSVEGDADKVTKKSTLNPNAKVFTPRSPHSNPINTAATPPSAPSTTPTAISSMPIQQSMQQHHHPHHNVQRPLMPMQQYNVIHPAGISMMGNQHYFIQQMSSVAAPITTQNFSQQHIRGFRNNKNPQQYQQQPRHDFSQPPSAVAAATGHPVLATAPITGPQQALPTAYPAQQTTGIVTQQGPPQAVYPNMFTGYGVPPRVGMVPAHMGMMQHPTIPYDPSQLSHLYGHLNLVSQPQVHNTVTTSGPHSTSSTPQSATPTTPLHGPPAPSPVHHQPNQPGTPTPVIYGTGVSSPHNSQTPGMPPQGGHSNSTGYPQQQHFIVLQPTGQPMPGHHVAGHGAQIHHALNPNPGAGNHPGPLIPVQLAPSISSQGGIQFASNPGV